MRRGGRRLRRARLLRLMLRDERGRQGVAYASSSALPTELHRRRLHTAKPDRASYRSLHVLPQIMTLPRARHRLERPPRLPKRTRRVYMSSMSSMSITTISIHTYPVVYHAFFPRPSSSPPSSHSHPGSSPAHSQIPHPKHDPNRPACFPQLLHRVRRPLRPVHCSQRARAANTYSSVLATSRRPRVRPVSS